MSRTLDTFGRLQRTERIIAYIRLAVVAFNTAIYFTIAPPGDPEWLALAITGITWVYTLAVVAFKPERRSFAAALSAFNMAMDNVLITLWLLSTGGFSSPWYPLFYAEVAASIGRFGLLIGGLSAIGSSLLYLLVYVLDGGGPAYVLLVRIGYLFFIAAFVGYVVDVARSSERAAAVAEAKIGADEQLVSLKQAFMSNISHELRTPLTAIRGAVATLSRRADALDEVQRDSLVEMIDRQSAHLGRLIQDLLDFSSIEKGFVQLALEPTDLAALLGEELETLKPESAARVRVGDHNGTYVLCDRAMIRRALRGLVDNALKFSPQDSIVSVSFTTDSESVSVEVSDQGIGISEEDRERIFEDFYQVSSSMTKKSGGTGIGLSVAAAIARLHGGEIKLASTPGQGSTFTLVLPKEPPGALAT